MKYGFLFIFLAIAQLAFTQALPSLIPFRQGHLWGYCDSTKKVIIPAKYSQAEPFLQGYALVYDKELDERVLIRETNLQIVHSIYPILMRQPDGNFIIQNEKGEYGLATQNLVTLVEPGYSGIGSLHGKFVNLFSQEGAGIYNVKTKKWAMPIQEKYEMMEHIFGPFYGLADGVPGFSALFNAESGKIIYKDISMCYELNEDNALVLFDNGKSGIMDKRGNISFKSKSRLLYPAEDNRIGFTADEKLYGYMNFKGKIVIGEKFDYVFNFVDNRAVVSENDKFGVIDTLGNWIIPAEYTVLNQWFCDFSENSLTLNKDDSTYFFDRNGKIKQAIPKVESFIGFENGIMCVYDMNKSYAFVNENGKFISDYVFSGPAKFENGIAKVSKQNPDKTLYLYYIDKYGTEYILEE